MKKIENFLEQRVLEDRRSARVALHLLMSVGIKGYWKRGIAGIMREFKFSRQILTMF